jgi:hypothetical protein
VDYADRLRTLLRPDLEELLAHRPETFALASRRTAGYGDLAGILAQPQNTARAVESLDRFHRQVLELACLAGGRLGPEYAARQGLEPDLLPEAAAELARRGLGFLDGWDLWLPNAVQRAVDDPGRVGPDVRALLEPQSVETLRTIAGGLGIVRKQPRKADLVAAIVECLHDDAFVRDLAAGAPPKAASVLQAVRAAGGSSYWSELAQQVPSIHAERGLWYSQLRPAEDGIAWLRARALVFWMEWDKRLLVPAEVELALRGRVFPSWEPEPPALDLMPLESDRQPVELVIEVDGLLDLWREPVALLQSGDLGVRECHRVATALAVPEGSVRFLTSLAVSAGLIAVEEPPPPRARGRGRAARRPLQSEPGRLVVLDDAAGEWRSRDVPARWAALVGPWRHVVTRAAEPLGLVLRELAALPEGRGAVLASLASRLAWRHPAAFASADAAIPVLGSAVATLHRLGIGTGPSGPVGGLSDLGRAALRGCTAAELAPLFPAAESRCTVTADLRVIVAGPPEPALARGLSKLAELETASPARVYRLSEASLRRAIDAGTSAAEMGSFLTARCPAGLPPNVAALIEDVGRRHGRLRVGRAAFYLQADDAALLAEVAANRRLRGLRVTVLAPTVAVVEGAEQPQVLEALRKAGYMPAVEGEPPAGRPRPHARRHPPPPQPPAQRPEPSAPDLRKLADRLLDSPRPVPPRPARELDDDELLSGARVTARADVERLLRLAVRAGRVVEIEYGNAQSGSVTTRVVEPRLAGDHAVVGWCRLRRDDRAFAFDGVRWARATGEAIQQVGLDLEGM